MPFTARDLAALKGAGIIDAETANRIEDFFASSAVPQFRFDLTHGAYYLGSIVVLWAMGWFLLESWNRYGAGVVTVAAVAYCVAFVLGGNALWKRPGLRYPAGLLYGIATGMVALAVFGLVNVMGFWPVLTGDNSAQYWRAIREPRLVVEASAVIAVAVVLRLRPFGMIAAGAAYALWAMSIDLAVVFAGPASGHLNQPIYNEITFFFGLVVLGFTFVIDRRTKEDYALWLYLSGMVAAWGALSIDAVGSWYYAAFNLGAMFAAVLLERPLFMVFGILGTFAYLAWLASEVFGDSVLFPLALIAIGVAIIVGGVWYRNKKESVDAALMAAVPASLREILPRYREPSQR
jgi:hypothetical protein